MSINDAAPPQNDTVAERLLSDPDMTATLVALSKVRTRDLSLPRPILKAYRDYSWRSRRKVNAAWMFWAAGLSAFCCVFTPFIASPDTLFVVLGGRLTITALLIAGALAHLSMRRPGWEGRVTIAVCLAICATVGVMGASVNAHLAERYIVQAIFLCGTAVVVSRIPWGETIALTIAVVLALTVLMTTPASDSLPLAAKLQMMAFFDTGLIGLALAKQSMNKLKYRVFVLGLVDRLKMAEIEEMNGRLHAIARTDPLTSVSNRRGFDEAFAALATRPEPSPPVAVFMIDIDFFKRLNDARGHAAGDECLKIVAGVVSSELRHGQDLLARFGGEEFVAILPGVGPEEAAAIAERVRAAVEARGVSNPGAEGGVLTVSVGVAVSPPASVERLVARADAALYEAKSGGRNSVKLAPAPAALRVA